MKISELEAAAAKLELVITNLLLKVSEKRLNEDPLGPIRIRRIFKKRYIVYTLYFYMYSPINTLIFCYFQNGSAGGS